MSKPFAPQVVTANDLRLGDVIYQTTDGWTRSLLKAEVLTDEAHAQRRLTEATAQSDHLVGAYLAEVTKTPNGPDPVHFREDFRATGPSNLFHGKQAEDADHV